MYKQGSGTAEIPEINTRYLELIFGEKPLRVDDENDFIDKPGTKGNPEFKGKGKGGVGDIDELQKDRLKQLRVAEDKLSGGCSAHGSKLNIHKKVIQSSDAMRKDMNIKIIEQLVRNKVKKNKDMFLGDVDTPGQTISNSVEATEEQQ